VHRFSIDTGLCQGLASGSLILASGGSQTTSLLHFDNELFFIYLLPPIIFNAGEWIL
jgi:hypothetical protein